MLLSRKNLFQLKAGVYIMFTWKKARQGLGENNDCAKWKTRGIKIKEKNKRKKKGKKIKTRILAVSKCEWEKYNIIGTGGKLKCNQ